MLDEHGQHPASVLAELKEEASGCAVYADCDLDAYWLETLAQACDRAPPFTVRYLGELLCAEGMTRSDVLAALDRAKHLMPDEHVARDDASRLALALRLMTRVG